MVVQFTFTSSSEILRVHGLRQPVDKYPTVPVYWLIREKDLFLAKGPD